MHCVFCEWQCVDGNRAAHKETERGKAALWMRWWLLCSMMPRLGRRSDRNATPPVDEAAEKAAPLPPESPGTPPLLPGGALAGNTIEDDTFFEHLPGLLQEIGERLTKLLVIEADAVQAAAALGPAASMQPPVARESVVALDVEPLEQVCRPVCP